MEMQKAIFKGKQGRNDHGMQVVVTLMWGGSWGGGEATGYTQVLLRSNSHSGGLFAAQVLMTEFKLLN